MDSISGVSGADHLKVLCQHIVVLNHTDHPLLRRAGIVVQQSLTSVPGVNRIDYLPPGRSLPEGSPAPDLVISLELIEKTGLWLPFYARIHANVAVETRLTPEDRDDVAYYGRLPWLERVQIFFRGSVSQEWSGVGFSSAPYALAAEELGRSIGNAIAGHLKSAVEKHGTLVIDGAKASGAFRPPLRIPILERIHVKPIYSGPAPLRHNASAWVFEDGGETGSVIQEVNDEMKALGWESIELDPRGSLYLQEGSKRFSMQTLPRGGAPRPRYLILYQESIRGEEVEKALLEGGGAARGI